MAKYTTDEEAEKAWRSLSYFQRKNYSREQLLALYEDFGGLETFKKDKLSEEFRYLRSTFIDCENFPEEKVLELFEAMKKIDSQALYSFSHSRLAFANLDVFMKLWALNKNNTFSGLCGYLIHLKVSHREWGKAWRNLSTIHVENCGRLPDDPHHWCYEPRVVDGAAVLDFDKKFQAQVLEQIHPTILSTIRDEVLSLSERERGNYADSVLVADEHWRPLSQDKRSVLNKLTTNSLLPLDLAYEIIDSHKTPSLRESIAKNTASGELLEYIWNGTASKSIRKAVTENTVSGRYITHPELLERY